MDLKEAITEYFQNKGYKIISIEKLGSGLVADGYKVEFLDGDSQKKVVCRRLQGGGMSHDYLSDKVGYLLMQHDIANNHPNHISSVDVVGYGKTSKTISLDGLEDVFQVVEFAHGDSYFKWVDQLQNGFDELQDKVIKNIVKYMKSAHSIKPSDPENLVKNYYWRHSQDFIGSEVLLDILDVWDEDDLLPLDESTSFMSKFYEIRQKSKTQYDRCALIHSDLHPDNIKVHDTHEIKVLDSARTVWGEPMDDLTSMLANYLFFGLKYRDKLDHYKKAYLKMLEEYFEEGIDSASNTLAKLFMPIRLLILAHPVFFPQDSKELKKQTISIAKNLLFDDNVKLDNIWDNLEIRL